MREGELIGGRFEIERLAGAGGMGEVFRALDRVTGEAVAVKVMLGEKSAQSGRFAREIEVLSELRHPAIVRYVAHGVGPAGEPFLAMEWLEGEDLSERLSRGALSVSETVKLGTRVAEALSLAHAGGVVHRDLKPSNLFLVEGDIDRVKVLDFGIAWHAALTRMTRTGAMVGTPGYMAPEQARGQAEVDARADVFSLGCVLFECLTGTPAFRGDHLIAVLAKVLFDEVPRLGKLLSGVPQELEALVGRMLAKQPEGRPRDGAAMAAALEALGTATTALSEVVSSAASPPRSALTSSERRIVSVVVAGRAPGLDTVTLTMGRPELQSRDDELRRAVATYGGKLEPLAVVSPAHAPTLKGRPRSEALAVPRSPSCSAQPRSPPKQQAAPPRRSRPPRGRWARTKREPPKRAKPRRSGRRASPRRAARGAIGQKPPAAAAARGTLETTPSRHGGGCLPPPRRVEAQGRGCPCPPPASDRSPVLGHPRRRRARCGQAAPAQGATRAPPPPPAPAGSCDRRRGAP
jgi:serine/threonine protein kinase